MLVMFVQMAALSSSSWIFYYPSHHQEHHTATAAGATPFGASPSVPVSIVQLSSLSSLPTLPLLPSTITSNNSSENHQPTSTSSTLTANKKLRVTSLPLPTNGYATITSGDNEHHARQHRSLAVSDIPNILLDVIWSYLDYKSLLTRIERCCTTWKKLSRDNGIDTSTSIASS
jgi:hypothetical protein